MIATNILLGIAAAVLMIGVIGEKDATKQKNIVIALSALLAFSLLINVIP